MNFEISDGEKILTPLTNTLDTGKVSCVSSLKILKKVDSFVERNACVNSSLCLTAMSNCDCVTKHPSLHASTAAAAVVTVTSVGTVACASRVDYCAEEV